VTLEALNGWATAHTEAAAALHKIIREALKTTGYRHIGKAILDMGIPEEWHRVGMPRVRTQTRLPVVAPDGSVWRASWNRSFVSGKAAGCARSVTTMVLSCI